MVTINGQDATVVMAHYANMTILIAALQIIANSDPDGEHAKREAMRALQSWDTHRQKKPPVIEIQVSASSL